MSKGNVISINAQYKSIVHCILHNNFFDSPGMGAVLHDFLEINVFITLLFPTFGYPMTVWVVRCIEQEK